MAAVTTYPRMLGALMLLLVVPLGAAAQTAISSAEIEARVDALLATLSTEQKIAQMLQPEIRYLSVEDVRRYGFGSVLNGGGSFPAMNKSASVDDWLALADAFYAASVDRSEGNAGIPIIWGTDAVHGHNNVRGATLFPHNIALGATRNPQLAGQIAAATAREVRATGIDWIFAPTVAVVKDPRWGRSYEGYSSRGELVAQFAGPVVRGLQSVNTAASAKHFIGDGGTWQGIDQGDTRLPLHDLLSEHGAGYRAAIDAGVLTIMASFNSWQGRKVHGHHELLTDVLKGQLGFDGMVVSDWNGIGQVKYCSNADCAQAINAGIDMVMVPREWRALFDSLLDQVRAGAISQTRIDDAVRRILRVKLALGLFDGLSPSRRATQLAADGVGSPAHRALAAQAVRESLVLLKNNAQVLPLKRSARILVAGAAADNIARQSGGWTLTWQGTGNANADFPGASSIFDGIQAGTSAGGGEAVLSADGTYTHRPDVAVVVFGETPYAEGEGDVDHLAYLRHYPDDLAVLRKLRDADIPVVSVFVTGRPRWINPELNASDALVVAWLPGSEGAAVADVLFAEAGSPYDFKGQLPMPWPAHDVNPANAELPVEETLFPFGYGLRLGADETLSSTLSEQMFAAERMPETVVFHRRSQPPWVLMLAGAAGETVRLQSSLAETAEGALRVSTVDYRVQEDARRFSWSAGSAALQRVYWTHTGGESLPVLQESEGEMLLTVHLAVEQAPTEPVMLGVGCGMGCAGAIDVTEMLQTRSSGEWFDLHLPTRCLAERGADLRAVTEPLVLGTGGDLQLVVADVRYRTAEPGEAVLACPE